MRNRIEIPKGIYGITGDNFSNGRSNYFCVEEMIKGGIKIVQYRAKTKDTREKVKEAREITDSLPPISGSVLLHIQPHAVAARKEKER